MRKITKRSKYNNKKILVNGVKFDSMKEYKRYLQLQMLERAGEITDLQRQERFVLIPIQKEPDTIGPKGGIRKGKTIEQQAVYTADFSYIDNSTGEKVVEDIKGGSTTKTEAYVLRRKLMLYVHGIRIKEV